MPGSSLCFFIATSGRQSILGKQQRALAQMLAAHGHRVVLFFPVLRDDTGEKRDTTDYGDNIEVVFWHADQPTGLTDARLLWRMIRVYHPDCLIAEFSAVNWMMLIGWWLGVPTRIAWHHSLSSQRVQYGTRPRWLSRLLVLRKSIVFRFATQLAANSEAARQDLIDHYSVDPAKIVVLRFGFADPYQNPDLRLAAEKDPRKIVCVAALQPAKGQDTLIRAAALLKQRYPHLSFQIQFIGAGSKHADYARLIRELGVEDVCELAGGMANPKVLEITSAAAVAVLPSYSEAFGGVLVEAIGLKTPVIGSAVGGIPEIVRPDENGFLVPPGDADALAETIALLLQDAALRTRMGECARQIYLDHFEQTHLAAQHAEVILGLAARAQLVSTVQRQPHP